MRNLIVALSTLVVFAIAAAGSGTPEPQKADCTTQSCCGGCSESTCK